MGQFVFLQCRGDVGGHVSGWPQWRARRLIPPPASPRRSSARHRYRGQSRRHRRNPDLRRATPMASERSRPPRVPEAAERLLPSAPHGEGREPRDRRLLVVPLRPCRWRLGGMVGGTISCAATVGRCRMLCSTRYELASMAARFRLLGQSWPPVARRHSPEATRVGVLDERPVRDGRGDSQGDHSDGNRGAYREPVVHRGFRRVPRGRQIPSHVDCLKRERSVGWSVEGAFTWSRWMGEHLTVNHRTGRGRSQEHCHHLPNGALPIRAPSARHGHAATKVRRPLRCGARRHIFVWKL